MQCTFTGLCGDTAILDIGGISNLFPFPKRSKIFHFKKLLEGLNRIQNRNFIVGGGLCTPHYNKYLAEVYIIYISKIKYIDFFAFFVISLLLQTCYSVLLPYCNFSLMSLLLSSLWTRHFCQQMRKWEKSIIGVTTHSRK